MESSLLFYRYFIIIKPPISRSKKIIDRIPKCFSINIFIGGPNFFKSQATKKKRNPRANIEAIPKTIGSK